MKNFQKVMETFTPQSKSSKNHNRVNTHTYAAGHIIF